LEVSQADQQHYAALSEYSRITAPFDGVVTWRYADTGSLIQAGTSNVSSMPVVKLSQVNVLRLRIPVPESLAASVRDGEPADIRVRATDERFSGKVKRSTESLDRSTRTMQAEVDVPNQDYKLTPGMYADVSLRVQNDPNALSLPLQAINRGADRTTVLLVNSQNHVEEREIRTGIEGSDRIQILSGLHEGDRVIVGNLGKYRPGQPLPSMLLSWMTGTRIERRCSGGWRSHVPDQDGIRHSKRNSRSRYHPAAAAAGFPLGRSFRVG
jgi:RND family efflux transporter MFP subunit